MERKNNDKLFNHFNASYAQSIAKQTVNHAQATQATQTQAFYNNLGRVDSSLNPRQIFWIKKRKIRRESLDALMKLRDSNYIYESRHRHAMKRQRAASGRFLTKLELLKMKEDSNVKNKQTTQQNQQQ